MSAPETGLPARRDVLVYEMVGAEPPELLEIPRACTAARDLVMTLLPRPAPAWASGHDPDGRPARGPHVAFAVLGRHLVVMPPAGAPMPDVVGRVVRVSRWAGWTLHPGLGHVPDVVGPARRWRAATPVVLDRFPRRGRPGVEAEIARMLRGQGINPVRIEIETSARAAAIVREHGRPAFELVLELGYDLDGPVLLGRLRHRGIGVLVPDDGSRP